QIVAKPVLGKGSQELVVFGKTMANQMTEQMKQTIGNEVQKSSNSINQVIVLLVIAIVISVTISTVFGLKVTRNIQETTKQMKKFSEGDLTTVLTIKSKDEFAQLATS